MTITEAYEPPNRERLAVELADALNRADEAEARVKALEDALVDIRAAAIGESAFSDIDHKEPWDLIADRARAALKEGGA